MYTGYFALTSILGGEALANLGVPDSPAIVLVNIATFLAAFLGYKFIHSLEKYLSIVFFIAYFVISIAALSLTVPSELLTFKGLDLGVFMLTVGIYSAWLLTFSPYVADYSRYLPENTSPSKVFWTTYLGSGAAVIWMMSLGAYLAAAIPNFDSNGSQNVANILGHGFTSAIYLIIVLGIIGANLFNIYGGFLSIITTLEPFTSIRGTVKTKFIIMFIVFAIGTIIAIEGRGQFLSSFSGFLSFLLFFMIPWTTINLIDYYFIRKGQYNVKALSDLDGEYGRFNWKTIIVFFLAVLFQLPFLNTDFYEGPMAKALGGADFAWLVGIVSTSILYYAVNYSRINSKKNENVA